MNRQRRARVEQWLTRVWYRPVPPPFWLRPLAGLFALLAGLRRGLFRLGLRRAVRLPVPVLVVGNITVGGTGKTPLTLHLARSLRAAGRRPGIVLRGYGAAGGAPRLVAPDTDPAIAGDEALLLARRSECPVAVGADRPAAARLLIEAAGVDCILSDDGLQHYRLARDAEIAVLDGARMLGNGWRLPAGPLREAPARLRAVDLVVINGEGGQWPGALRMRLRAEAAINLATGERRALVDFLPREVHAVAGIGHPQRFFALLSAAGLEVLPHVLPDHAALTAADIRFDDGHPVIMTEKDAVKCRAIASRAHWYLPVEAEFSGADGQRLRVLLAKLFRKA